MASGAAVTLAGRTDDPEQAQEHLAIAGTIYDEMGMTYCQTLGAHIASEIFHGGLEAAASVRDAQRLEWLNSRKAVPSRRGAT